MKRLADLLRIRTREAPVERTVDQLRHLPQQLFDLSLQLDVGQGQLVFSAAELIELQAAEINRLQQAARDVAEREKAMSETKQTSDDFKYEALWMLTKFLHATLADLEELLDPRSKTPLQDSQTARAKTLEALKVARRSGVLS